MFQEHVIFHLANKVTVVSAHMLQQSSTYKIPLNCELFATNSDN